MEHEALPSTKKRITESFRMQEFIEATRHAIKEQNWYGALWMALTLPDICGAIEFGGGSQSRYARWFDEYVGYKYRKHLGPGRVLHIFLTGNDCYALRCAVLHQGSGNISGRAQMVRDALDSFRFTVSKSGYISHNNQTDRELELSVPLFCSDMVQSAEIWANTAAPEVLRKISQTTALTIHYT